MEHEHTVDAIRERLAAGPHQNYLRDWIYGGIDGLVTTFAVVSGVVGAGFSPWVILVMGFANLFADGFSMAASNFLGTKAEHDDLKRLEAIEYRHVEIDPDGEREEVRQIFESKGFSGDELGKIVTLITADRAGWVRTMLTEEYGLPKEIRSEWRAALSTFAAFVLCGSVPLMPFVFGSDQAFVAAAVTTGFVFVAIGSVKARWSTQPWWRSGITTFLVGGVAATLAFLAGLLLKSVGQ